MKSPWSLFLVIFLLGFHLYGFTGCSTGRMSLPKDLSQGAAVVYAVTGRQGFQFGPIRFGPYSLQQLDRGITTSEQMGLFVFQASRARRPFHFVMHRPDALPVPVSGRTNAKWMDMAFSGGDWRMQWGMRGETITTANFSLGGRDWVLVLSGNEGDDYWLRGVLTDGEKRWEIVPIRRLQSTAWDIEREVGFSFQENGRTLGAVEVINAGQVFFRPDLPAETRDTLAAAFGVLLLDLNLLP